MSQYYQPNMQPPPPPDNSGMKTCLLIGGILGGVFLLIMLICGGTVFLVVNRAKTATEEGIAAFNEEIEKANERIKAEEERRKAPPASTDAAIKDLMGYDHNRHVAAFTYLRAKSVEPQKQKAVALGLVNVMERGTSENKKAAVELMGKWGDPSIAPKIADSLRYHDETTPLKLDLLAKYKDAATYSKIAAVLENNNHGEKAKQTLQKLGPDTAGAVAEYLGSSNANARTYSKELLASFDVDVNSAMIKLAIERLKTGDSHKRSQAAKELAALEFDEKLQPEIVTELNGALNSKDSFVVNEVVKALVVWGDKTSVEPLERVLRSDRFSSTYYAPAFEVLGKFGGEKAIPTLVKHLADYSTAGEAATDALIEIGPASADEVVVFYNSDQSQTQKNARTVLSTFEDVDGLITDQCVVDLKSGKDRVAETAMKWLATSDVIEDKSTEVSTALAAYMTRGNVFNKREASTALARWSTLEQKALLLGMVEDDDETIWKNGYNRLVELQAFDDLKQPTGVMLTNFFKRGKVSEILRQAGPPAEPLVIAMLEHSEEDALVEACKVLAAIGGEDSLAPLEALMKKAQRVGSKKVIEATRNAGNVITVRVKDAKKDDDDS